MNAAAKVIAQDALVGINLWNGLLTQQAMRLLILVLFVLISAFGVVYTKDVQRRLMSDWQGQQMVQEQLKVKHTKLLLEQATWAAPSRVQMIASHDLRMVLPRVSEVVIVKR